jgi:hypothetical protein
MGQCSNNDDHHTFIYLQLKITTQGKLKHKDGTVELHGNISQNGYENAIISRYGDCFEEGYKVGLMHQRKLHCTRVASKGGRVGVRIIHGLNINHKELTYLLQKVY